MSGYYRISQALGEDPELSLELRCADDRGAGYKDEASCTAEDLACIEDYEETREAQLVMASEAETMGIAYHVEDSDDRDSRHSDAYLYFPQSRLAEVAAMLERVGLPGDILDVPAGFPADEAERLTREYGWTVERAA